MSIPVEAIISDSDLASVRDMRDHAGDELQIIHRLLLGSVLTVPELTLPSGSRNANLSRERTGRIMYLPTRSA